MDGVTPAINNTAPLGCLLLARGPTLLHALSCFPRITPHPTSVLPHLGKEFGSNCSSLSRFAR